MPVTLNLVVSGTATYGSDIFGTGGTPEDYQLRARVIPEGETDDTSAQLTTAACREATGSSCQVTVTPGSTIIVVEFQIAGDGRADTPETIIFSVTLPSAGESLVELGTPSSQTLNITTDA